MKKIEFGKALSLVMLASTLVACAAAASPEPAGSPPTPSASQDSCGSVFALADQTGQAIQVEKIGNGTDVQFKAKLTKSLTEANQVQLPDNMPVGTIIVHPKNFNIPVECVGLSKAPLDKGWLVLQNGKIFNINPSEVKINSLTSAPSLKNTVVSSIYPTLTPRPTNTQAPPPETAIASARLAATATAKAPTKQLTAADNNLTGGKNCSKDEHVFEVSDRENTNHAIVAALSTSNEYFPYTQGVGVDPIFKSTTIAQLLKQYPNINIPGRVVAPDGVTVRECLGSEWKTMGNLANTLKIDQTGSMISTQANDKPFIHDPRNMIPAKTPIPPLTPLTCGIDQSVLDSMKSQNMSSAIVKVDKKCCPAKQVTLTNAGEISCDYDKKTPCLEYIKEKCESRNCSQWELAKDDDAVNLSTTSGAWNSGGSWKINNDEAAWDNDDGKWFLKVSGDVNNLVLGIQSQTRPDGGMAVNYKIFYTKDNKYQIFDLAKGTMVELIPHGEFNTLHFTDKIGFAERYFRRTNFRDRSVPGWAYFYNLTPCGD